MLSSLVVSCLKDSMIGVSLLDDYLAASGPFVLRDCTGVFPFRIQPHNLFG